MMIILLILLFSNISLANPLINQNLAIRHLDWIENINFKMLNQSSPSEQSIDTSVRKKSKTKKKKSIDLKLEIGFIKVNSFKRENDCLYLSEVQRDYIESSIDSHGHDLDSYPLLNDQESSCRDQLLQSIDYRDDTIDTKKRNELLTKSIVDRWIMRSLRKSLLPNESLKKTMIHTSLHNKGFEIIGYLPVINESEQDVDEKLEMSTGAILILGKFNQSNLAIIGETGGLSISSKDAQISIKAFMGALAHNNMINDDDSIKVKTSTFYQEQKKINLGRTSKISIARLLGYLSGSMLGKLTETINFSAKGELHLGVMKGSNLLTNSEIGFETRGDENAKTFIKMRILKGYLSSTKNPRKGNNFLKTNDIHLGQIRSYESDDKSTKFQIGLTLIQPTNLKKRAALGQMKLEILPSSLFSLNLSAKGAISQKTFNSNGNKYWAKAKADTRINVSESGFYLSAYYFIQTSVTPIQYGDGNVLDMDLLPIEVDGSFYQYGLMVEYVFE